MNRDVGPIVLVGLSGAGKTAVGRLLAERLVWTFVDLDAEVERRAACTIAELFQRDGERAFRDLEAQVTRSIPVDPRTIVSTGGGWMARPELRDTWPHAVRVWLRVEPDGAMSRLARERLTRPLLAGPDLEAELRRLLGDRLPAYRLAEIAVETDGLTPAAVVDAILDRLAEAGRSPAAP
ncbi:MAG: shikimate kinase [Gemmatimonadetes bacterium]|nr:shikimate kinase [Gemmatimonadota bacterium]NNK48046.1 shikimate kinase [Gemmatimonadota bacterium]